MMAGPRWKITRLPDQVVELIALEFTTPDTRNALFQTNRFFRDVMLRKYKGTCVRIAGPKKRTQKPMPKEAYLKTCMSDSAECLSRALSSADGSISPSPVCWKLSAQDLAKYRDDWVNDLEWHTLFTPIRWSLPCNFSSLRKLHLEGLYMSHILPHPISYWFPNLAELTLQNCTFTGKSFYQPGDEFNKTFPSLKSLALIQCHSCHQDAESWEKKNCTGDYATQKSWRCLDYSPRLPGLTHLTIHDNDEHLLMVLFFSHRIQMSQLQHLDVTCRFSSTLLKDDKPETHFKSLKQLTVHGRVTAKLMQFINNAPKLQQVDLMQPASIHQLVRTSQPQLVWDVKEVQMVPSQAASNVQETAVTANNVPQDTTAKSNANSGTTATKAKKTKKRKSKKAADSEISGDDTTASLDRNQNRPVTSLSTTALLQFAGTAVQPPVPCNHNSQKTTAKARKNKRRRSKKKAEKAIMQENRTVANRPSNPQETVVEAPSETQLQPVDAIVRKTVKTYQVANNELMGFLQRWEKQRAATVGNNQDDWDEEDDD